MSDRREAATTRLGKGDVPLSHCIPHGRKEVSDNQMTGAEQGAKKRSESRQKQERLTVRFTSAERDELETLADRAGLTLGSYVRSRSLENPTTRAMRRPPVEVQALSTLQARLNKVGSNLNQIARGLNMGATPLIQDIQAALAEHRQILAEIITTLGRQSR